MFKKWLCLLGIGLMAALPLAAEPKTTQALLGMEPAQRQVVARMHKALEKAYVLQARQMAEQKQAQPADTAQTQTAKQPVEETCTDIRCTECGKTPVQAAKTGHPHKPPYTFQATKPASAQTAEPSGLILQEDGSYIYRTKSGLVYHLNPSSPQAQRPDSTVPHRAHTDAVQSVNKKDYPPYW